MVKIVLTSICPQQPQNYYLYRPSISLHIFLIKPGRSLMFAEFLKERTAIAHASLEKKLILQIRKIKSTAAYTDLLQLLYPFHVHTSAKLGQFQLSTSLPGHDPARASHIQADLEYFGIDPGAGIFNEPSLQVNSMDAAWGIRYVLEGSSLGGRVITQILARSMTVDPSFGFSFFDPYREETPARWEQFKSGLNEAARSLNQREIADAANDFFYSYHQWICEHESVSYQ